MFSQGTSTLWKSFRRNTQLRQALPESAKPLVCFDNFVVGTGFLTDHGLDHTEHGRKLTGVKHHDLQNVGHGDAYYRFRETFMERAGLIPPGVSSLVALQAVDGVNDVIFLVKGGGG